MGTVATFPLYAELLSGIEEHRLDKQQAATLRESLAYLKVCGINAAKAYVHYREQEEEWAKPVAAAHESALFEISREMQRVMGILTDCEGLDGARNMVVSHASTSLSYAGEVEPGKLLAFHQTRELLGTQVENAIRANAGRNSVLPSQYSRATVAPFTEMWKECMELIDPNEEFDIQMFYGDDDPVFSVTVLATTCPISKEPYFNVVRTPCNHRFNRSSIESSMLHVTSMQCPIAACSRVIRRGQWVADPEYENRVKASEKKRKEQTQRNQEDVATLA